MRNKRQIIRQVLSPGRSQGVSFSASRREAKKLGIPLAFLYAESDVLAEAILTMGLLSKSEQRKAVADLKARLIQAIEQGGG